MMPANGGGCDSRPSNPIPRHSVPRRKIIDPSAWVKSANVWEWEETINLSSAHGRMDGLSAWPASIARRDQKFVTKDGFGVCMSRTSEGVKASGAKCCTKFSRAHLRLTTSSRYCFQLQ